MGIFETILGLAVAAIALWLMFGSSPQGRPPAANRADEAARRRAG